MDELLEIEEEEAQELKQLLKERRLARQKLKTEQANGPPASAAPQPSPAPIETVPEP